MNPILISVLIVVGSLLLGGLMGALYYRKKHTLGTLPAEARKLLNDPEAMANELKKHGKIYDVGEEIVFNVATNPQTGNAELQVSRIKLPSPAQEHKPIEKIGKKKKKRKKPKRKASKVTEQDEQEVKEILESIKNIEEEEDLENLEDSEDVDLEDVDDEDSEETSDEDEDPESPESEVSQKSKD